jgi:hypothetical protein
MATDYLPTSYKNLRDWLQVQKDKVPPASARLRFHPDEQAEYLGAVDAILPVAGRAVEQMD